MHERVGRAQINRNIVGERTRNSGQHRHGCGTSMEPRGPLPPRVLLSRRPLRPPPVYRFWAAATRPLDTLLFPFCSRRATSYFAARGPPDTPVLPGIGTPQSRRRLRLAPAALGRGDFGLPSTFGAAGANPDGRQRVRQTRQTWG